MSFTYAPYATGKVPFTIGLDSLDPADWIEPDDRLAHELAVKDALIAERYNEIVREEPDTRSAQAEVGELLVQHLLTQHAKRYRADGRTISVIDANRSVSLDDATAPPLLSAARLIQDDLILMRKGTGGWRIAAAVLAAPSAWSLDERFGQTLDQIHAPVPGYAGQMAARMARIFDNLRVEQPVWRLNWSLYDDAELFHGYSKARQRKWSGDGGAFGDQAFIRVERQTLRRLAISGDILFTIRVYVDPVSAFQGHAQGRVYATRLGDQLAALKEDELRYKGLLVDRDRILAALRVIAAEAS